MGATTPSPDAKPGPRPSRQRAKTLPTDRTDTVSESDNSTLLDHQLDSDSRFRSLRNTKESANTGPINPGVQDSSLSRHGTLLSSGATTLKRTVELKSLLGNANSRLPPGALISHQPHGQEPTSIEQAKPRARVEIDIMLHSNVCVEGGTFKGFIKLRIRPRMTKESAVSISDGKLRIIGFETVQGDHHEFFQYSAPFSAVLTSPLRIYNSPPDSEGFCNAEEGVHKLEFEMQLPMGGFRPKGPFYGQFGVAVRYIALVSIKVKDEFNKRSIAHFYRDCEIWPRLNPSVVLAPAEQLIQATISKALFMGGNGEVQLTATLHRSCFVAGAPVSVNVEVNNGTKKLIKSLTLTLYRSTIVFKRKLPRDPSSVVELDIDACQTTTIRKAVATSTLEMAQGFPRGHASTSGWWAGIPSGERLDFSHFLLIPPDALTHTRERLIEVEYTIRVSLNVRSLTTDVGVDLPIRIVNLLSLDPPPTFNVYPQGQSSSTRPPQSFDTDSIVHALTPPESYDHDGVFSDAGSDADDDGFEETFTEEDPQLEIQLGNLSLCDDTDDLVHHAIVSAQMDNGSEKALRVPDEDQATEELAEECVDQEPETYETSNCSEPEQHSDSAHDHTSRSNRPRGPSSFALRVQRKLEVAANARQSLYEQETLVSEIDANQDAVSRENAHVSLAVPSGSAISRISGYQVASSSFLDDRYFGFAPRSKASGPSGSRMLPEPPTIVGLPFPVTATDLSEPSHVFAPTALGIASFGVIDKQTADLEEEASCSLERLKEQLKPRRPSIAPRGSSAVKDKIRELEERVRAAEGY
ncbi:hypothetical protein B0H19DRAFT_1254853 [Mycena capillaripes]|nr:hypothetical protein B0H19DRAFT_1254853 [Mycena capillaripes]